MVTGAETTSFVIFPSIILALILGILELIFLSHDESGAHWFMHGLHAIPVMLIFTFLSMNIGWALQLIGMQDNFMIELGARFVLGIIATIKVKAAAALVGKTGIGESFIHALIIGILIAASPYLWFYVVKGLLTGKVPDFLLK